MQKVVVFFLFLLQFGYTRGQISQHQKDSLLTLLKYPATNYTFTLYFNTSGYIPPLYPDLQFSELSIEQLQKKLQNNYRDALLYCQMSYLFYNKREFNEAEKYYYKAVPLFKEWHQKDPRSSLPYLYHADFLLKIKSYALLQEILKEGIQKFPEDKAMMVKNIECYL